MQNFKQIILSNSNKFISILKYQYNRMASKGYSNILPFLIFVCYFTIYIDVVSLVWPILLNKFTDIQLFVLMVTFINVSIHIIYSFSMYYIYVSKIPFFQQYRISKQPWPWQTDKQKWYKLLQKTIINFIINILIIAPILIYYDCTRQFKIKMQIQQAPNTKFTYFWQFALFLIANQIWNYLMHALMHHPKFYWIHKPHHQYAIPVSISGLYVHPIQYIISSTISTSIGYKILINYYPVHIFSIIIWLTFRNIQINDSHSGYNWPWAVSSIIPFNTCDNYHYFHHRVNLGNYSGILYFMDSIFGTNQQYWKYQEKLKIKLQKVKQKYNGNKQIVFYYGKQI